MSSVVAGALALFQSVGCVLQGHVFGVGSWVWPKMPPLAITMFENGSVLTIVVAALVAHLIILLFFFCNFTFHAFSNF
jgi:hypothetical protein